MAHSLANRLVGTELPSQSGQVRVFNEQAVVAHACHGHRYRPSPVHLSGTGIKKRGGGGSKG